MNKVALITGATRGIGKQIALTLAKEGYNIALNYRTENDEVEKTKKEIESLNVECLPIKGDVSSFEDCENMTKETFKQMMNEYLADLANQPADFEGEALNWAVQNGLMAGGIGGNLMPKKFITRGESILVLQRFFEKFLKK